jgi:hypothetical protein
MTRLHFVRSLLKEPGQGYDEGRAPLVGGRAAVR